MSEMTPRGGRKPNHLADETSPYLLQHLHNPVDWHPWSPAALALAADADRPIFLSIGYSACHWCHVMERESFEDTEIAELINRHFVPIKVDREERPDLDDVYMNAVQLLTGQGGWPLTVVLTPELEPFFGGTYFPPRQALGRPGLDDVLRHIVAAWSDRRADVLRSAAELTSHLRRIPDGLLAASAESIRGQRLTERAAVELAQRFDRRWGGFGTAPKFPPDGGLNLLLLEHARGGDTAPLGMVETTLDAMAGGGMYDHVGGGFCRYSVDERWLVPHFEKMLYNQALLVPVYLDAWLISRKPLYRRVVEQTLDFVRRELTGTEGGFHSSLDADSEHVEGKFYVWTPDEIAAVLGAGDADLYCDLYGITAGGNFEGRSIPNLHSGALADRAVEQGSDETNLVDRLEPLRRKLLVARERRIRPGKDDKVLTAWNGLMISACARAHRALGRPEDLETARRGADFVVENMLRGDRLLVSYRAGKAKLNAYLDDYAFFARGLLDLYETCFEPRYLEIAGRLARTLVERFEDRARGGFFFVSDDHEALLLRNRSLYDTALPSGGGVAVELLGRLAAHLDDAALRGSAERALTACGPAVERMPSAGASLLLGAEFVARPPLEVAIVGRPGDETTRRLLSVVRGKYRTGIVVQVGRPGTPTETLLAGKQPLGDAATAYVCRDRTCSAPTTDPAELARLLD